MTVSDQTRYMGFARDSGVQLSENTRFVVL